MQINLNLAFLFQWIILIIFGCFIGNTLSILTDKNKRNGDDTQKIKVLQAISIGLNLTIRGLPWLLLWLALFITIPLLWHSIYQR